MSEINLSFDDVIGGLYSLAGLGNYVVIDVWYLQLGQRVCVKQVEPICRLTIDGL